MVYTCSMNLTQTIQQAITKDQRTLVQLAAEAHISAGQLSRLVRGQRSITLETADRLADALNLRLVRRRAR